jgi:short-subunit dehydrogenase
MPPMCAVKSFLQKKNLSTDMSAQRIALVTGASKGLGFEVAKALSARGYSVILGARNRSHLEKARKALPKPAQAVVLAADVAHKGFAAGLQKVMRQNGMKHLDVVVHAAAVNHMGTVAETKPENAELTFQVNAYSVISLAQATEPYLEAAVHPRFVLVSSLMQYFAMPGRSVYAASKAAAERFAVAWGHELAATGSRIKVQVFRPAGINTGFHGNTKTDGLSPRSDVSRMGADESARYLLRLMDSGAAESAPGIMNKVVAFTARHFPRLTRYLVDRRYRRVQKR